MLNCVHWRWQCPVARNLWDLFVFVWCIVSLCIGILLLQMALWLLGLDVGCALNMRERLCSFYSRWSMQSNPSTGWPSLDSTHCHKLFTSLESIFKSAWLLGRRLPRWPSTSEPLKAIVSIWAVCTFTVIVGAHIYVSGIFYMGVKVSVFACLSCSSMVSGHSVDLYVAQYDWYLSQIFWALSWVVNPSDHYFCCGILSCAEHVYRSSTVESLTRQEWRWACCCVVQPSPWSSSHEVPAKLCLVVSFPSQVSANPFCLGCTICYCSTARSLVTAPV